MKKFLTAMVAGATLFSAGAAFAANQVQVTLTSPTIVKSGCEKAGAITFAFDNQSRIKAGDWWYLDLPLNVTLCKSYDYVIGATTSAAGTGASQNTVNNIMTFAAGAGIPSPVTETFTGPITATRVGVGVPATSPNAALTFRDWDSDGVFTSEAVLYATMDTPAEINTLADAAGDGDGTTTAAELSAFISTYDRNLNGAIDALDFELVSTGDDLTFKVVGAAGSSVMSTIKCRV